MATTNHDGAEAFQSNFPHTFNSLQHLVMAMAKVYKNQGKKSFFGKDKGLAAYKTFEEKLRDTILAMVLDNLIKRNSPPSEVLLEIIEAINVFSQVYPNWQDAYQYAAEYFIKSAPVAEDRIKSLLQ